MCSSDLNIVKDKTKECPWVRDRDKDRVRDQLEWRTRARPAVDLGDLEWVGGWSEHLHM